MVIIVVASMDSIWLFDRFMVIVSRQSEVLPPLGGQRHPALLIAAAL
jgi:hypothetical protein